MLKTGRYYTDLFCGRNISEIFRYRYTGRKKKQGLTQAHALQKERILYEDANILLYNKPAGLLSQKAEPDDISVNEMFLAYLLQEGKLTQEQMATCTPSICNRLDRNTSGILICGKTYEGLKEMNALIKERRIGKFYRCIVTGSVNEKSTLTGYLTKDEKTNKVTLRQTSFPGASYIETSIVPIRQYRRRSFPFGDSSDHRKNASDPCPSCIDRASDPGGL